MPITHSNACGVSWLWWTCSEYLAFPAQVCFLAQLSNSATLPVTPSVVSLDVCCSEQANPNCQFCLHLLAKSVGPDETTNGVCIDQTPYLRYIYPDRHINQCEFTSIIAICRDNFFAQDFLDSSRWVAHVELRFAAFLFQIWGSGSNFGFQNQPLL